MKSDAKNIGPSIRKGTFILFQALERKIEEEETRPLPDTIRIHSLKKEKLRLKEELLD